MRSKGHSTTKLHRFTPHPETLFRPLDRCPTVAKLFVHGVISSSTAFLRLYVALLGTLGISLVMEQEQGNKNQNQTHKAVDAHLYFDISLKKSDSSKQPLLFNS
ncbi:hypothetical protein RHGRI_030809 [Rhododendron griersonianum]|uniref:Uncharacterized protein n=1 Tax=Rhododendron griersonianum TaxID=479676 RepID=A0AAV6I8M5_9ERIC|nr:hypothetical protein RHGRI_030809 [Rhododendron griersonianum]